MAPEKWISRIGHGAELGSLAAACGALWATATVLTALTPDGDRAVVRAEDPALAPALLDGDPIGTALTVAGGTAVSLNS